MGPTGASGRFRGARRANPFAPHPMKPILFYCTVALLTAAAPLGLAKDKDDKKKGKDRNKERVVYVERDGSRYYRDGDGQRQWIERSHRGPVRDRSRTIYVIERNRPVERVVYIDGDGSYYRVVDGRRYYVQERVYETYPSRYYYPDGRRRLTITLPF